MIEPLEVVYGTENVFADLGEPDAEYKFAKAKLASDIVALLNERKLTVRQAAKQTGFDPADIQRIRSADLSRFSIDRLIKIANRLGRRVELTFAAE